MGFSVKSLLQVVPPQNPYPGGKLTSTGSFLWCGFGFFLSQSDLQVLSPQKGLLQGLYSLSLIFTGSRTTDFPGNLFLYSDVPSKGIFLSQFFTRGTIFYLIVGLWPGQWSRYDELIPSQGSQGFTSNLSSQLLSGGDFIQGLSGCGTYQCWQVETSPKGYSVCIDIDNYQCVRTLVLMTGTYLTNTSLMVTMIVQGLYFHYLSYTILYRLFNNYLKIQKINQRQQIVCRGKQVKRKKKKEKKRSVRKRAKIGRKNKNIKIDKIKNRQGS